MHFAHQFAHGIAHLRAEGACAVLALAQPLELQGCEIIHLEIGQPDLKTPSHVALVGIAAIWEPVKEARVWHTERCLRK